MSHINGIFGENKMFLKIGLIVFLYFIFCKLLCIIMENNFAMLLIE